MANTDSQTTLGALTQGGSGSTTSTPARTRNTLGIPTIHSQISPPPVDQQETSGSPRSATGSPNTMGLDLPGVNTDRLTRAATGSITELATAFRVNDPVDQKVLVDFSKNSSPLQSIKIFAVLLAIRRQVMLERNALDRSMIIVKRVEALMEENVKLTDAAQEYIGVYARKCMLKPVPQYKALSVHVFKHVAKPDVAAMYDFGLLLNGGSRKFEKLVVGKAKARSSNARSNTRDRIVMSVEKKQPLETLAASIVAAWDPKGYRDKNGDLSVGLLARLALIVYTSDPDSPQFWSRVDAELKILTNAVKGDRNSPAWLTWEKKMIQKDEEEFPKHPADDLDVDMGGVAAFEDDDEAIDEDDLHLAGVDGDEFMDPE